MVELFEGRLGGGKTYSATVRIVDHLRRGGLVATNIDLIWDEICNYVRRVFAVVLEDDQLIRLREEDVGLFHRVTPSGTAALPVLVVIDEAHLTFNARDFAKTDKLYRETLTFLTQSRKVFTDVIFISQSVLNMDKQFMRLVQYIWRFRDLALWKIPGLGIRWPLKQILAVQFDYDGRTVLQRTFVRKDKRVFALFRTNSLLREFPRLEVGRTNRELQRASSPRSMAKLLIPLGIVAGIIGAIWLYHQMHHLGDTPGRVQQVSSVSRNESPVRRPETSSRSNASYEIYSERFKAWTESDHSLETEEGWYQLGEMSNHGFVVAVSSRRAKIGLPDGGTGWVVALNPAAAVAAAGPATTATPVPAGSPVVAQDHGLFPPTRSLFHEVAPYESHEGILPIPTASPVLQFRNGHPISPGSTGFVPTTPITPTPEQ
jgi:hypothetical protein